MIIEITTGQIMWLIGVLFIIISLIPIRSYFSQFVYDTPNIVDDADKIVFTLLFICGLIFIFLGVNHDFKLIEVKVI